eukprot:7724760-Pyramimonas_sp.AAC.2
MAGVMCVAQLNTRLVAPVWVAGARGARGHAARCTLAECTAGGGGGCSAGERGACHPTLRGRRARRGAPVVAATVGHGAVTVGHSRSQSVTVVHSWSQLVAQLVTVVTVGHSRSPSVSRSQSVTVGHSRSQSVTAGRTVGHSWSHSWSQLVAQLVTAGRSRSQ